MDGITTLNIVIPTCELAGVYEQKLKHNISWKNIILDWAILKERYFD